MSYVETAVMKNSTIMMLYAERDEINMNPEYQRMGGVWTLEKKQLLIDSILNDYDIPKIYFHELSNEEAGKTGHKYAVIDGRQRLEAIWAFMDGDFTLSKEFEYQRDPSIQLTELSYEDIAKTHPKIRIKFDSFILPVITVGVDGDEVDLIEDMFSRLNEAVPLNAAEKRNAIGGNLVKAITDISGHIFFVEKVKFRNNRYQHKEAAAKFLLLEDSLKLSGQIIDTKKVYLDNLARKYKDSHSEIVSDLKEKVSSTLDIMTKEFATKDDLLMSQGITPVYYLIFRQALLLNTVDNVSRRKLIDFRRQTSENRNKAARNYEEASFDLLEFDRLNQQGTNDASSIKERCRILGDHLGIPMDPILPHAPSERAVQ